MKILYTTTFYPPYHVGGACTHVYYLANEVAKEGHEVHVVYCMDSYNLKKKGKVNTSAYPNHKNITLHPLKSKAGIISPVASYITGYPFFKGKIKEIIEQGDFDIIHHHNISLLGPKILDYGNCLKIYTSHDSWLVTHKSPLVKGQKQRFELKPPQLFRLTDLIKEKMKVIDALICPSKYMKRLLSDYKIIDPEKMHVIPNFVPEPKKTKKISGKFFFYAGQISEGKGIRTLLSAFKDPNIKTKLILAGRGELDDYVRKFIKENKLEGKIEFIGWQDHSSIYDYYANAEAYILASNYNENCSNGILEALSVGTPSLGSNTGGTPELISDREMTFIPGDPNSLKTAIRAFEKKKISRKELKTLYSERFSPKGYVKQYFSLIEEVKNKKNN